MCSVIFMLGNRVICLTAICILHTLHIHVHFTIDIVGLYMNSSNFAITE